MVQEEAAKRTTAEWVAFCDRVSIPCMPVLSLADLPEDPHVKAVGLFGTAEHPSEGRYRTVRSPVSFSTAPFRIRRHAPRLGEHTAEVLAEAGLSSQEIQAVVRAGAAPAPDRSAPIHIEETTDSMTEQLKFSITDGIARIVLDRPERMNAFTFDMIDAWTAALQRCRTDDAVKVVIVTGTGAAFCSGGDIVEMGDRLAHTPEQRKSELFNRIERIPLALEDLDKPVIAAVNGVATGAGMDMALMCDLRYSAQSARFAETYVKVGLVPGAGGAHFLPRLVGVSKALELFLTGDFVDAQEALRIGLVNKVFPDSTLAEEVDKIARRMLKAPSLTLRMTKRAIYQGMRNDLRTNLDLISSHYAVITATEEHQDLVRSFIAARSKKPGE